MAIAFVNCPLLCQLSTALSNSFLSSAHCFVTPALPLYPSGAYFKYSSGGTPVFLWSRGYGAEGQDDVGDPYRFVLGEPNTLPRAVVPAMEGMRVARAVQVEHIRLNNDQVEHIRLNNATG